MGFKVKLLDERAKVPTCAHPGLDLGYDLYALEHVVLRPGVPTKVRTGVAVEMTLDAMTQIGKVPLPCGSLLRDRSSMASKGIMVSGGVIDAGYRGEIIVVMTYNVDYGNSNYRGSDGGYGYDIQAGDKIAQLIPMSPLTRYTFESVEELGESERGTGGFGSTGE